MKEPKRKNICLRCTYEWVPRKNTALQCPRCKRYDWDIDKEEKQND